jgi:hypothetical protein
MTTCKKMVNLINYKLLVKALVKKKNQQIKFSNSRIKATNKYINLKHVRQRLFYLLSTSRKLYYSKHLFICYFLINLLKNVETYSFIQISIFKKLGFDNARVFFAKSGFSHFLLAKKDINYLRNFNFNIAEFNKRIFKGGYTFFVYLNEIKYILRLPANNDLLQFKKPFELRLFNFLGRELELDTMNDWNVYVFQLLKQQYLILLSFLNYFVFFSNTLAQQFFLKPKIEFVKIFPILIKFNNMFFLNALNNKFANLLYVLTNKIMFKQKLEDFFSASKHTFFLNYLQTTVVTNNISNNSSFRFNSSFILNIFLLTVCLNFINLKLDKFKMFIYQINFSITNKIINN